MKRQAAINQMINSISKIKDIIVQHVYVDRMINGIEKDAVILEIGGGYNPRFYKSVYHNAYHLDHCDKEALRSKYSADENVAHRVADIQDVDFVFSGSSIETLIPEETKFDYVYSSHNLEHQVDLVGHFRSLEKILKPRGKVVLVVPDHRACFDRLRFPTVTSDVLAVYLRKQSVHQGKQIYEAMAQGININPGRIVTKHDLSHGSFFYSLQSAYAETCVSQSDVASYRDVHAWTFTPTSFRLLMIELFLLELISLEVVSLSPTYGNQFCAVIDRMPSEKNITKKQSYEKIRYELSKKLYVR